MNSAKSLIIFFLLSAMVNFSHGLGIPPYSLDPRFFYIPIPLNNSNKGSNLNQIFGLPGEQCSSRNIFTGKLETGTCRDYFSCVLSGQRISGVCTLGLKTCCVPSSLLFVNPNPVVSRSYNIKPVSRNYCQVRFDFETLVLDDPVDGNCFSGKLTFSGQKDPSANVPVICGKNTGQHMYLNFNNNSPITMSITTTSSTSSWRIKATKILCNDRVNLAPSGCLQYFKGNTGTVQSFNYRNEIPTVTNQLNNQNYKVCLDTTIGATSVIWSKPISAANYFFTINGVDSAVPNTEIGTESQLSHGTTACPFDYVIIKGGSYTTTTTPIETVTDDRFCGLGFPTAGITATAPLELQFITNGDEMGETNNNGFFLSYLLK